MALVYDELAYMLEHNDLDKRMQLYISESITADFIERYVADVEAVETQIERDARNSDVTLKPQIWMNLDGQVSPLFFFFLIMAFAEE